ncbi:hypothetical protein CTA2_3619 [Colletotrichum tanaceti]|uniref:ChrR-like cupin domain-containing protein n=1 Tax=Colletotrichum tanaceti TaxID=1306861 RepID=A0A4U6XRA0_9PEZI|nr:hypothetical protein CTA2_3619 [Colletotrichum tanaceti]TKW58321.1 hypothetical protein CTA1_12158 [Colletotrichum tanaceti]
MARCPRRAQRLTMQAAWSNTTHSSTPTPPPAAALPSSSAGNLAPLTASPPSSSMTTYVEEIHLADDDLVDLRLDRRWERGAYAYRKHGMEHGPFRSEAGCLMFILCILVDEGGREVKDQ